MNARKISVSVPADRYQQMERIRKRLKLGRSEAVQQAVDLWIATQDRDERVAGYLAGYLSRPEDAGDARALVGAWAQSQAREDW